jgi:hypothetical protein
MRVDALEEAIESLKPLIDVFTARNLQDPFWNNKCCRALHKLGTLLLTQDRFADVESHLKRIRATIEVLLSTEFAVATARTWYMADCLEAALLCRQYELFHTSELKEKCLQHLADMRTKHSRFPAEAEHQKILQRLERIDQAAHTAGTANFGTVETVSTTNTTDIDTSSFNTIFPCIWCQKPFLECDCNIDGSGNQQCIEDLFF